MVQVLRCSDIPNTLLYVFSVGRKFEFRQLVCFILQQPRQYLRECLLGYWLTDGTVVGSNARQADTESKVLRER